MTDKVQEAFAVLKQAMIDDGAAEQGGYAHSWHCNIAMMCYDAIKDNKSDLPLTSFEAREIGNDAASRFMKLCFDVDTEA
ncbi:MAG: hypothetical protein COB22_05905 [Cycloclasticus sp.]|nr:MAG: hypothetical protein COB22_05905 [Cycloclasticus sp.]